MKHRNIILLTLFSCLLSLSFGLRTKAGIRNHLRDDEEDIIRRILKEDYPTFVKELGDNITDPKFRAAIRSLADKNKVKTTIMSVEAKNLTPTQFEIDLTKSMKFLLTSEDTARKIFGCQPQIPIKIADKAIVTSGLGEYIIDGHHRWSQVYIGNKKCLMETLDLNDIDDPIETLKATQLAIAGSQDRNGNDITSIPQAVVTGENLYTITKSEFEDYVLKTLTDKIHKIYKEYKPELDTKQKVSDYFWKNVHKMQNKAKPVNYAPSRAIMPQTDNVVNWPKNAPLIA